jgi:hypothetical protein
MNILMSVIFNLFHRSDPTEMQEYLPLQCMTSCLKPFKLVLICFLSTLFLSYDLAYFFLGIHSIDVRDYTRDRTDNWNYIKKRKHYQENGSNSIMQLHAFIWIMNTDTNHHMTLTRP